MSENSSRSPEVERTGELHTTLIERLDTIHSRSALLGVDMNYVVTDQILRPIAKNGEDASIFAASEGKLPLTLMALATYRYSDTVADLLDDMLARSSNDAYRVLAEYLGGPDAIQAFYARNWRHTSVHSAENGRTEIGETTPVEALYQFRTLLSARDEVDPQLDAIVKNALFNNEVENHGIRVVIGDQHPRLAVWNKTGEYNGDIDTPYSVRHDVGAVYDRVSEDYLFYAVMTKAPLGKKGGWLADQVVARSTAEVMAALGHHDSLTLGAKAMRFSGLRLPFFTRASA